MNNFQMNRLKKIRIQGFKSIVDQEIEPGQVNVLIGANGSGKTALLEAIGMLSAAISGTVDNEALQRRGVHLTTPQMYKSSFKEVENHHIGLSMQWQDENALWHYAVELENENSQSAWTYQAEHLKLNNELILQRQQMDTFPVKAQDTDSLIKNANVQGISALLKTLKSYAIYTPITPMLRDLITDPRSFSEPFLGLSGNRLANAMQDLIDVENETYGYLDLDEVLDLLDWIDSIKVESQNADLPKILRFTELFMRKDNNMFTAQDASEGSLYVFFLLTLAMHPEAPLIFAVENFDQALHPRLAPMPLS